MFAKLTKYMFSIKRMKKRYFSPHIIMAENKLYCDKTSPLQDIIVMCYFIFYYAINMAASNDYFIY